MAELYLAVILAACSFIALLISLFALIKTRRILSFALGLLASVCAIISMRLLHNMLVISGHPTSALGAVFGPWGQDRLVVPIAYSAVILAGIAVAVFSLAMKKLFCLAIILLLLPFGGCKPEAGEPDRLGSWNQINQQVERSSAWRQIVTASPFQLGEKSVKGSWFVPDGTEDYYEIKFGSYPSLDGSTVAVPMAVEFARQHLRFSDEDANDFAGFSTTHGAYVKLIAKEANTGGMIRSENTFTDENHPVDLIIATPPSEDELSLAQQHGVTLVTKPVCFDAFVFITHKDNPVSSLTAQQVRDIYSGKITNWKDVGGDDTPITAYQREENSGSQTAMIDMVMNGTPMLPPEMVKVVWAMGSLIDAVAEYQNNSASLGYTYKFYIDTLYKNENIKILEIDGIYPDEANLRAEAYPFTACYYGVIRAGDEAAAGGQFLDWILSAEGQQCVRQAGYIPYYGD